MKVYEALVHPGVLAGVFWILPAHVGARHMRIDDGELLYDTNDRWNDGADRWQTHSLRLSSIFEECSLVGAMSEDDFDAMPRDRDIDWPESD